MEAPAQTPSPEPPKSGDINLFSYLQVLLTWRRLFIINILVIAVPVAVYMFLQPNVYKATSSIIPPKQEAGLTSAISQLTRDFLPSTVVGKLGAGKGGYNYLAILNSRTAMEEIVRRFHLMTVYDTAPSMDRAILQLRDNSLFDIGENADISVSVFDTDPKRAAAMANAFVEILNGISVRLETQEAKNNRLFIQKRYEGVVADLRQSEDSLRAFQERYGLYSLPDQAKAAIEEAAELKAQATLAEVELGILERSHGPGSPATELKRMELEGLNRKLSQLKFGRGVPEGVRSTDLFIPFMDIPNLGMQYLRLYRNFEIQNKILQFTVPLYEQAKIDEQKTVPVVLVLDKAVAPERKWAPKRSLIILVVCFAAFLVFSLLIFFLEAVSARSGRRTGIEATLARWTAKLRAIYRVTA